MPVLFYFLAYLLACLGVAVVIVPLVQPWLYQTIGLDPESSLYRVAMLSAILGMPLFLRTLGLNSWKSAGFTLPRRAAWSALARGLLVGIGIMIVLTLAQWLLDIRYLAYPVHQWDPAKLLHNLLTGLTAGLAVGLIEETFFRGLLHTGMRRSLGFWPTATLTALLYAALHFMEPEPLAGAELNRTTALDSIITGFGRIGDFAPIADSFITLVVVGLFLSMVRERTGNIIWAIAIHAGWVMIIKLVKYLTNPRVVDGETSFWIGSYDNITGWMATLWLGAIAVLYWMYTRPRA